MDAVKQQIADPCEDLVGNSTLMADLREEIKLV